MPPLAYYVTYRICLGLQQHDREVLAHGVETGIIKRLPDGRFVEVHQPLAPADEHGHGELEYVGCAGAEEDEPARRARARRPGLLLPDREAGQASAAPGRYSDLAGGRPQGARGSQATSPLAPQVAKSAGPHPRTGALLHLRGWRSFGTRRCSWVT